METLKNIEIFDTAYGGYGVGKNRDGQIVFVSGAVEGDICDIKITEKKKSFLYGKIKNINRPSDYRVEATCKQADKCGGCSFCHINYDYQLIIKEKIIKNIFRKFNNFPNIITHKSNGIDYRIRAKVRAKNGKVGFIGFKSNDFIPVDNCQIIKPSLFNKIKEFANVNNLSGEVEGLETPDEIFFANVKSNYQIKDKSLFNGISINGKYSGLKYSSYNTKFGDVGVTCGSFFQSNRFLIDEFQEKAISLVPEYLSVAELYAGSGFFTCGLINNRKVKATEFNQRAVELGKIYNLPIVAMDSGRFLKKIKDIDVVFLDPPRAGVDNNVIKEILRIKPLYIIYVSCNPQTLSRDIIKLSDSYKIETYDIFDMFRDTYHIESIVLLSKSN